MINTCELLHRAFLTIDHDCEELKEPLQERRHRSDHSFGFTDCSGSKVLDWPFSTFIVRILFVTLTYALASIFEDVGRLLVLVSSNLLLNLRCLYPSFLSISTVHRITNFRILSSSMSCLSSTWLALDNQSSACLQPVWSLTALFPASLESKQWRRV